MTEEEERQRLGGAIDGFRRFAEHVYDAGDRIVASGTDADHDRTLARSQIVPTGIVDGLVASVADHLIAWTDKAGYGTSPAVIRLSTFADYTMLRPIIEALAGIVWILGPDESNERIRRAIQFAHIELMKGEKYVAGLDAAGTPDREMARTFEALRRELESAGARAGLTALPRRALDPSALARNADPYVDGPDGDTFRFWAIASAHAHSQLFTMITLAARTIGQGPNGPYTYVETDSEQLMEMLEFTLKLLNTAVAALNRRGFRFARTPAQ